jgi:hypothetical protein
MRTETHYCRGCDRHVRIAWTPAPGHEGHATLPDGPEMVCLDLEECCTGGLCPLSNLPRLVMGVRLARSELRPDGWPTAHLRCVGCEQTTEMRVVDDSHVVCAACGTVNPWVLLELMEQGYFAVPHAR